MMPKEYPPWQTVYDYYRQWQKNGKWDLIHDVLRERVREQSGKKPIPSVGIIDSRSVKTAQKGGGGAMMEARKGKGAKTAHCR
jgi:transposase